MPAEADKRTLVDQIADLLIERRGELHERSNRSPGKEMKRLLPAVQPVKEKGRAVGASPMVDARFCSQPTRPTGAPGSTRADRGTRSGGVTAEA